jgi:DNA-binding beta-propeller fold protein YncE
MDYRLYNEIAGSDIRMDNWPLRKEFRLYIRKDVANQLWGFDAAQSPPPPAEVLAGDPFAAGQQSLAARQTWGTSGSATGPFSSPHGIATSPSGFVYVADSGNNRIQQFTADGRFVTAWGTAGNCDTQQAPPGAFCDPWGVAVGPDGSVYVADTWAHRIQKFTADGEFVTQWGSFGQYGVDDPTGGGFFYGPRSVVIGPDGAVYVSDTGNKRVQVFDANGAFLRQWGGAGTAPGQLDEPVGLAVGPGSLIYVADTWNRRIQALSPDGTPRREWPVVAWESQDAESKPFLAADAEGQIYATDPDHDRVLVFDAEGNALYSFGQAGSDNASFGRPSGLAVGAGGLLYVTDAANNRVMVFAVGGSEE